MRREKKIFSLIVTGLLFVGSGPVFAGGNSSGKGKGGDSLKKAREVLEEKLMGQPGIAGMAHLEEEGVIAVFLENEQAKRLVPDSFEGFPVRKVVTGRFQVVSGHSQIFKVV